MSCTAVTQRDKLFLHSHFMIFEPTPREPPLLLRCSGPTLASLALPSSAWFACYASLSLLVLLCPTSPNCTCHTV